MVGVAPLVGLIVVVILTETTLVEELQRVDVDAVVVTGAVFCQVDNRFDPPQIWVELPLHVIPQAFDATLPEVNEFPQ